jgi:hypothetical protein
VSTDQDGVCDGQGGTQALVVTPANVDNDVLELADKLLDLGSNLLSRRRMTVSPALPSCSVRRAMKRLRTLGRRRRQAARRCPPGHARWRTLG